MVSPSLCVRMSSGLGGEWFADGDSVEGECRNIYVHLVATSSQSVSQFYPVLRVPRLVPITPNMSSRI